MPAKPAPAWRRRLFVIIALILVPLWIFGIWKEYCVEADGRDVMGKVVLGRAGDFKRPRFVVEFPTASGPFQKEFGFTREEGVHIRGGTEGTIVNPDIMIRYHEEYPDAARLASSTPLPWWGGVIGMMLVVAVLSFSTWLPDSAKRSAK